jgi:hypothetical protein
MSKNKSPERKPNRRAINAINAERKAAREKRNKLFLKVGAALLVIGFITYLTVLRPNTSEQNEAATVETGPRHHTEVVVELPTEYEMYRPVIEEAAQQWFERFECVILDEVVIDHKDDTRGDVDLGEWVLAYSEPGKVHLGTALLTIEKEGLDEEEIAKLEAQKQKMVGDTVSHELTHACIPKYPTMLATPIKFSGGEIIGFHGLGILVRLPDGTQTTYGRLDEGAAEANAVLANPNYEINSAEYYSLQRFALSIQESTDVEYLEYVRRNDVPGFVSLIHRRIMGRSVAPEQLTGDDYDAVMTLYERSTQ